MDKELIKNFALDVLGCGCDHSVFNSIEVTEGVTLECGVRLDKKILIGRRLLIYIASAECCAPGDVGAVIAEGIAERDTCGYNRLRLVIITADSEGLSEVYSGAFDRLEVRDDKCHIHVVKPEDAV